ncbi:MAG: PASTA domain-containing protein [Thermoleophilia bacterium]|nr:PASTA domain-containing protein [Thermoleophilia bacterium]
MAARLTPTVARLLALILLVLLSTATIGFAADQRKGTRPADKRSNTTPLLTVPDVRGQAYVFAKGMLEDAGFAWRVTGPVGGFAANLVARQSPAPGTRIVDTGEPTLTLTLSRSPEYAEEGTPESTSPYIGSAIRLPTAKPRPARKAVTAPKQPVRPKAAPKKPVKPVSPPAKPVAPPAKPVAPPAKRVEARPPAFEVPGAPKEPLAEITLPARARKLEAWIGTDPKPTDANVSHWLYQHTWIVTGAKFGWWHGAEALRTLIRVDDRVVALWGIGNRSRAEVKAALREVEAKSK